ncbi:Autophagy-related protein [Penicillium oxalicum]|uniref:Autophagy-related protein n=1 Tax=Penicillium oxalicum TaxID=69781 RepID=UPI0020B79F77|nr:Autophagy-related protein [Penicillium oxalicum]KAI2786124.1 Autophagy-related protein [Penicillium oxalicum]
MLATIRDALSPASPSDEEASTRPPRYDGEDTTPTSPREIAGWYCYGIAAEVFAVCGVGSFLPLTLEQLARENGILQTSQLPCWGPSAPENKGDEQCIVNVLGLRITTASFAMYTFSLAVLVQALTLISFSALADYVVGVTCLGSSFVVLNSFLPLLVANHPSVQHTDAGREGSASEEMADLTRDDEINGWNDWDDNDSSAGMHADPNPTTSSRGGLNGAPHDSTATSLQLSTKISAKGVGLGYCAAVLVQILSIGMLILLNKTSLPKKSGSLPLRFVLLLVGLWWCAFTLVTRQWLRDRPGPPLDTFQHSRAARWRVWLRLVSFAWRSLWQTITIAVRLREVIVFLVAWFLLSDAMATVSGTAILFARTELQMSTTAIGCLSVTVTLSGMAGAFLWPHVSRRFGLEPNHTIMVCIALFEIIPLEAAFYALYAATDKGSSFIGPAIVGVLIDATGTVRAGFFFIAILIVLPIPLVWMVDAEKGRNQALKMASSLVKSHESRHKDADDGMEAEGLLNHRS